MKIMAWAFAALFLGTAPAMTKECRRVTTPTVLAVVAHGGVWTRPAERGKTYAVSRCGIRMFGKVYCQLAGQANPSVYLQDSDRAGREFTAFWGKACR